MIRGSTLTSNDSLMKNKFNFAGFKVDTVVYDPVDPNPPAPLSVEDKNVSSTKVTKKGFKSGEHI